MQARSVARREARVVIEPWRRHYSSVRPHSGLDHVTPNEFKQQYHSIPTPAVSQESMARKTGRVSEGHCAPDSTVRSNGIRVTRLGEDVTGSLRAGPNDYKLLFSRTRKVLRPRVFHYKVGGRIWDVAICLRKEVKETWHGPFYVITGSNVAPVQLHKFWHIDPEIYCGRLGPELFLIRRAVATHARFDGSKRALQARFVILTEDRVFGPMSHFMKKYRPHLVGETGQKGVALGGDNY